MAPHPASLSASYLLSSCPHKTCDVSGSDLLNGKLSMPQHTSYAPVEKNMRTVKIKNRKQKTYPFHLERVEVESHIVVSGLWSTACTSGKVCLPWSAIGWVGASSSILLSDPCDTGSVELISSVPAFAVASC